MARTEEVELTNMCMICDGRGNVLVQDKRGNPHWQGWNFPGGHVEPGEFVAPSVIREIREETGLTIVNPKLCGIKEFHKSGDGKRYIVFLYTAHQFIGTLRPSAEGAIFWYPLADLLKSDNLIPGFAEMLPVFTEENTTEMVYEYTENDWKTIYY